MTKLLDLFGMERTAIPGGGMFGMWVESCQVDGLCVGLDGLPSGRGTDCGKVRADVFSEGTAHCSGRWGRWTNFHSPHLLGTNGIPWENSTSQIISTSQLSCKQNIWFAKLMDLKIGYYHLRSIALQDIQTIPSGDDGKVHIPSQQDMAA